jgi:intein/homing endonuclease
MSMNRAVNWSYISGFFDADGSIKLKSKKYFRPSIEFYNTEISILLQIKEFIKNSLHIEGKIYTPKLKKIHHTPCHVLSYSSYADVIKLSNKLKSIHPKKSHRLKITYKLKKLTNTSLHSYKINAFYKHNPVKVINLQQQAKAA